MHFTISGRYAIKVDMSTDTFMSCIKALLTPALMLPYWVIFIPPLKSRRCPSRRISSAFTYVFQITQTVTLKYPSLSRKMRKNQVVN